MQVKYNILTQAFNPQGGGVSVAHAASATAIQRLKSDRILGGGVACAVCQDEFALEQQVLFFSIK